MTHAKVPRHVMVVDSIARVLGAMGLWPRVTIAIDRLYALESPPAPFRDLGDLVVREALEPDAEDLGRVDGYASRVCHRRFQQGDLAFVAVLNGALIAQIWFHRGPAAFTEDRPASPEFVVPDDAFWSYHLVAVPAHRGTGAFGKAYQVALARLFERYGARHVFCRIAGNNQRSIALHDRAGFRCLGELLTASCNGAHFYAWRGRDHRWRRAHFPGGQVHLLALTE